MQGVGKGKGKGKGEENSSSLLFPSSAEGGGEIAVGGSAGRRDRRGGRSPGEEIAAGGSAGGIAERRDRRGERSRTTTMTANDERRRCDGN